MIDHLNLPVRDVRRNTSFYLSVLFAGFFFDPDGHNVEVVCHERGDA